MNSTVKNAYAPDVVSHPGVTLAEAMEERAMSQAELSRRLGRPKKTINEIIQAKSGITSETALQLEKVLGIPADFWVNRQRLYDESVARSEERSRLEKRAEWVERFPIRRMTKLGWIEKREDKVDQLIEVLRFFGIASPDQWDVLAESMLASFRLARTFESSIEEVAAWLRRGELESQPIQCRPYDMDGFMDLLRGEIRSLTRTDPAEFQPRLTEICASVGVAVALVPQLPKARVCGATRWLSPEKALIQLSLRYKTDDHLWFTFFHEAAHIVIHGKRDIYLESTKDGLETEVKEQEADAFAADMLIPPEALKQFLDELSPGRFPTRNQIVEFATRIGIAPSIVVGRLQHDRLPPSNPLPFSHYHDLKMTLVWAY